MTVGRALGASKSAPGGGDPPPRVLVGVCRHHPDPKPMRSPHACARCRTRFRGWWWVWGAVCSKCEGGSASTKHLTSVSFTVYSPWHLGSPNIAPVLALCDRGYNHVTSARYAEVGVDFRRPHARSLVCGRLRTDAIRPKGSRSTAWLGAGPSIGTSAPRRAHKPACL